MIEEIVIISDFDKAMIFPFRFVSFYKYILPQKKPFVKEKMHFLIV
tara:strand:+ start:118 stop:255 length:138 start_codon:yes stop_codon:yes gene_type:complete